MGLAARTPYDRIVTKLHNFGLPCEWAEPLGQNLVDQGKDLSFMTKLHGRIKIAWDQSFPVAEKKREVGFTIDIQGKFSPFTYARKRTFLQWLNGLGGTLDDTRPEPEDTIWGFHTHPFGKLPYPSDGDKITSTRYGRPESMIGETQIGTFNPHSRSNGEPPLRILAR